MTFFDLHPWIEAAAGRPHLVACILAFATLLLEDGTTVAAALLVHEGAVRAPVALVGLILGITAGDMLLFGLGRLARRLPRLQAFLHRRGVETVTHWMESHTLSTVLVARIVPGLRLPTYVTMGMTGVPFSRFALIAIGAVIVWTLGLFFTVLELGQLAMEHLGQWRWIAAVLIVVGVLGMPYLVRWVLRIARILPSHRKPRNKG